MYPAAASDQSSPGAYRHLPTETSCQIRWRKIRPEHKGFSAAQICKQTRAGWALRDPAVLPLLLLSRDPGTPAVSPSCRVTRYSRGGSCHVTDARDLAGLPSMPDCCHETFSCCCIPSQGFLKKEEAIFRFETERVFPSLPDCCHATFNRCCILSLEVSKKRRRKNEKEKKN